MRKFINKIRPFLVYFMIIFFIASYSLFKKNGAVSSVMGRDLFFVFWIMVLLVLNFIIGFVLEVWFVGIFFRKLRVSISALMIGLSLYIFIYNVISRGTLYYGLNCLIILLVAYFFYDTLSELSIADNILFDVVLKLVFSLIATIALYVWSCEWKGIYFGRIFYAGFASVALFLMLSLLRYIPNAVFENFSKNLMFKYCIGCFLYTYMMFIRAKLIHNNFINVVEWVVVCGAFGLYFYSLTKNIKKISYNSYNPLWGKHKQLKTIIRNEEFSNLSNKMDEFIDMGRKTELVTFLFGQLFGLGIEEMDINMAMNELIEHKDRVLPRYASRYKLEYLISQNKNYRYLIVESTIKKINRLMEEKL
ncbi:MAG: hypothetical protein J6Y29_00095 [Clostridiales bacterium]|nr:hypothetical protein [Clostridiales bacterium]